MPDTPRKETDFLLLIFGKAEWFSKRSIIRPLWGVAVRLLLFKTMNRYTTAQYLMLLFPNLKEEKADAMITDLLRKGELKSEEGGERDDVGGAWTISDESWTRFKKRTQLRQEEVKKKQVKDVLKKLDELLSGQIELKKNVAELSKEVEDLKRLQVEGEPWKQQKKG